MDSPATPASALDRGRAAFARSAWSQAYAELSDADRETPLEPDDLQHIAVAAYLLGKDAEYTDLLTRAHHELLSRGELERAVRCAYWIGHGLFFRGEHARGGGWLARAQRLLEDVPRESVERGYLQFPVALQSVMAGDFEKALSGFNAVCDIATRFGDRTLGALGMLGQGRTLIKMGDIAKGSSLLDETMAAIEAGDVSPITVGVVYCGVIEACTELFDVRRAQEWTSSLNRWCEAQPDLVPFRGVCLVHRAELFQLHGNWPQALTEAKHARERLSDPPPPQPAVGAALYREAELHRLRGDFAMAEQAYRESGKWSRKPRPGLAQLRLAQGQLEAAAAAIRALASEAREPDARARILAAWVDIAVAAGDHSSARAAADELSQIAATFDAPAVRAMAAHAEGATRLAEGDPRNAHDALQLAWSLWQELEAPYEAARVRVLIGLSARALGDHDAAAFELDAARTAFRQLGAAPDVARIDALAQPATSDTASGLTSRELQVLRQVAKGKSNKAIAQELFISEKTVHRHVSNIFLKLGVSSRAAATAYAFQHDLA